jgi:hypothetical protein
MTWGRGAFGQLGHEFQSKSKQSQNFFEPTVVKGLIKFKIQQVA